MQERGPIVHEHDAPPGLAMTVYPEIVEPPSDAGAVQDTTLCAFTPPVAETLVGTPGCGVAPFSWTRGVWGLIMPARLRLVQSARS